MMDRKGYIGGSDIASILGISPWKSSYRLYLEKIGEAPEEYDPRKEKIFARGKRLEPVIVEMVLDELHSRGHDAYVVLRNVRYQDEEYDFLRAEIDVEIMLDGELTNVEIKTVHPFAAKHWGEEGSDEVPLHYLSQVMFGLMVKPRPKAIVAALIGADDLRIHYVDRDEELINIIRAKALEFWSRVMFRDPPPVESFEDVKHLYKQDQGLVIDACEEMLSLCSQLREHKDMIQASEQAAADLVSKIKLIMGDAAIAIHNDRKLCTWATSKQRKVTDWESLAKSFKPDPEIVDMYTSTKPGNRPFILRG